MKKITLMLCSMLMATNILGQYGPKTINLTDAERTLVKQNSDFAFNLFRQTRNTENHVISPLSITYALGMLNNGAEGITRQEISQVLSGGQQTDYADVATMNAFCRKMLTESTLLDENTRVAIANNIYFNADRKELKLKKAFKEAAASYYDATPSLLSFSDEATLGTINQWVTDRTDGMIQDLLKPADLADPNLVSFLLNAISFKGTWVNQFDEKKTQNTYFANTATRTAMMMTQVSEFLYSENQLYQSVILPYGNGSYQMTVFLPRYGKTLDDVLAALNGTNWNTAKYSTYSVWMYFPRIETDTELDLVDVMASLGMKNAFLKYNGHGFFDFCQFGDNENNSDQCWISMMRQKAHLKLNEKDTEAAAATVIGMEDEAAIDYPHAEFVADRPFLYIISERSTGSIFFIGQYMGEPMKNVRHDISLSTEEKQLVSANNDFAFNLFRKARGEENCIMSPLSITYALGMLNNGAAGQTQQEINKVLGFGEIGADGINQFCRKMLDEAATLDKETKAEIANTVFVNSSIGYSLQQGFIDKANTYYDAQPQALNFYDSENTINIINQWADDHTHSMIPKLLDEETFNNSAASYLLNALYFKGVWANKFDKEYTKEESFDGGEPVPMMHQQGEEYEYTENDLYQAVRLPYGNGAYQMTVYLPREDKTIDDVLSQMNGENWQAPKYWYQRETDLKLPRIKTDNKIQLVKIMKELGMPSAFDPTLAEFPYFGSDYVYISNMFQTAIIDLDEKGTEAAAVTVIEYETTSIPSTATFHANRPFFYTISERSTGVIFFIGQYVGNTQTLGINNPEQSNLKPSHDKGKIYDLSGRKLVNSQLKKGLYIIDGKKIIVK